MLSGDQTLTMPESYVHNQRFYNTLHSNGRIEVWQERAERVFDSFVPIVHALNKPHRSFLDVGCRTGYVLYKMLEAFPSARVVGVEIVPEFAEAARETAEVVVEDMHNMSFADKEFDWVFCSQTLEHCYDVRKGVAELFRVARHGVMLSLPLENKQSFDANPSHYAYTNNTFDWLDCIPRERNLALPLAYIYNNEFNLVVVDNA